jgi:hypothetical protein
MSWMRRALFLFMLAVTTATAGCDHKAEPATGEDGGASSSGAPRVVNGLPIPSASVAARINPDGVPEYKGPTGSVEGTILVTGDPAPPADVDTSSCPEASEIYGTLFRAGPPSEPGGPQPLADAIVAVTGYAGYVPAKEAVKSVYFDHCTLGSRTVTMTFGQRLELANKSTLLVAPELEQDPKPALMIAPPGQNGDPVKLYPPKPGWFNLVDKARAVPYLRVDVFVLLQPLHAVTGPSGYYRIDGVPVGSVNVGARLPVLTKEEATAKVDVQANVVSRADLTLHYTKPPPPPKVTTDAGKPKTIIH